MKISENVYIHITYTFIWLNPHQPPNSLDPEAVTSCRRGWRPPCPCIGHYLWDLGPKGGQGVMRLFMDLSLNFAPHEIILRITLFWAGRPDFLGPVVLQPSASPGWFWLFFGGPGHKIPCPREAKRPFLC